MDAVKFVKARARMCKSYQTCSKCPLNEPKMEAGKLCIEFVSSHPEETVAVVEKWLIDHPIKTMADDFFEKYPSAPRDETYPEQPKFCPMALGFPSPIKGCLGTPCTDCWGREVDD